MPSPPDTNTGIALLPDPELVRDRLARLFAEARILRGLLRLSEQAKRHQEQTTQFQEREARR